MTHSAANSAKLLLLFFPCSFSESDCCSSMDLQHGYLFLTQRNDFFSWGGAAREGNAGEEILPCVFLQ
jgi:hypothetical protein